MFMGANKYSNLGLSFGIIKDRGSPKAKCVAVFMTMSKATPNDSYKCVFKYYCEYASQRSMNKKNT